MAASDPTAVEDGLQAVLRLGELEGVADRWQRRKVYTLDVERSFGREGDTPLEMVGARQTRWHAGIEYAG